MCICLIVQLFTVRCLHRIALLCYVYENTRFKKQNLFIVFSCQQSEHSVLLCLQMPTRVDTNNSNTTTSLSKSKIVVEWFVPSSLVLLLLILPWLLLLFILFIIIYFFPSAARQILYFFALRFEIVSVLFDPQTRVVEMMKM